MIGGAGCHPSEGTALDPERIAHNLLDEEGLENAKATALRCLEESERDRSETDQQFWAEVLRLLYRRS